MSKKIESKAPGLSKIGGFNAQRTMGDAHNGGREKMCKKIR